MNKKLLAIISIVLVFSMMFAFAGCTPEDDGEVTTTYKAKTPLPIDITTSMNDNGETFTMTEYTPEQLEANSDEIFAYFIAQSEELKTAKAAVKISLSKGITKSKDANDEDIPYSDNDTLNSAIGTLSNYMLITGPSSDEGATGYVGTEKGQVVVYDSETDYGEVPAGKVLPIEHLASLTRAEVESATCKDDGPLRTITITLKDGSLPETVEKVYVMGDKEAVMAELATASDFMKVSKDPVLTYDNCQMIVTVNLETDEITAIEYIKRINVSTAVVGAGTLAGLAETPVNFCYESFLKYELDRVDPNAPVAAE